MSTRERSPAAEGSTARGESPRVAVLFERFGPYHHARVHAAAAAMPVHAIEIFQRDATYAWNDLPHHDAYPKTTLFTDPSCAGRGKRQALWRAMDRIAPAAVAIPGWGHWYSYAALAWAKENRARTIVMSETTRADAPRRPLRESVKRAIVRGFDAALVGGAPQRSYLMELGFPRERIELGYDAVDNGHFIRGADAARSSDAETRKRLHLPDRYFVTSCRFISRKNVDGLIRAFAGYVQDDGAECDLVVVGDGPERSALAQLAELLGVGRRVHFMGFRQYSELPALYALAIAFILASHAEPWGLVVNEALACGVPVLVSDVAGCAEDLVVPGLTGWRFAPRDIAGLTRLLHRVATNGDLAREMGLAGRRVVEEWGPERFASGLANACRIALANPPANLTLRATLALKAASFG